MFIISESLIQWVKTVLNHLNTSSKFPTEHVKTEDTLVTEMICCSSEIFISKLKERLHQRLLLTLKISSLYSNPTILVVYMNYIVNFRHSVWRLQWTPLKAFFFDRINFDTHIASKQDPRQWEYISTGH